MFLPRKQKQLMKERRRKKKLAEKLQKGEITQEEFDEQMSSRKRSLSTDEEPTNNVVIVPAKLSSKDARKFRKDARRKAREQGIDESKLQFVNEGQEHSEEPPKKKKKRVFPSINELVKKEKEEKEKEKRIEKIKDEDEKLSDEDKSRYVALDCEMVGVGSDGKKSVLARVSLTDWDGNVLLDNFVKVPDRVTDFRTHVSGVTAKHIKSPGAIDPKECREKVASILKGKVLVGHALKNDLDALMLQHPKVDIRDTAKYKPFQWLRGTKWRPRKLRDLVKEHLDLVIQEKGQSHDSVSDAKATMDLFKIVRESWEKELELKSKNPKK